MNRQDRRSQAWEAEDGSPHPLGAQRIVATDAFNFAIYSKHAQVVILLLYTADDVMNPVLTFRFDPLKNKTGRIWHCRISQAQMMGAVYYGYRIDGPKPNGPFEWHWFDHEKILLDPYAKSVFFPASFDSKAAESPGSNAGKAALGVCLDTVESFDWNNDSPPRHQADTVIYELHVSGFTKNPNSGVSKNAQGTFEGLIEKIPYLKELGVTVVELMPIFQYVPSDENSWGYMPLNFFSPHHGYFNRESAQTECQIFCELVRAFHREHIEIVIDVVYNHTGEGGQRGPVYSYKGIDNSTYYLMSDKEESPFEDFSGTGNTLNCTNRYVRKLIMDSIRHWATVMKVDGFRFDLASIFARTPTGFINTHDIPVMSEMFSDPDLTRLRLIVEPWDAVGAYQLGRAFPGILASQWNGQYRDDLRRFVRGDPGMVPAAMSRLYGSSDLFPDDRMHAYHPPQSINYVCSHDGFTLYDLVAYNHKRNEANGHNNDDGVIENFSWNCGWEGDEAVPLEVMTLRKRQIKNFCCLLFLSNGTPMIHAGDEFMRTLKGNNNPYNQDSELRWIDWNLLEEHADMFRFFKTMIAFRKNHPSLSRNHFWRDDIHWYGLGPTIDLSYHSHGFAYALRGALEQDSDLYVMINAGSTSCLFHIQEGEKEDWRRVVDTSCRSPSDILEPGSEHALNSLDYEVSANTVVVLIRFRLGKKIQPWSERQS